MAPIPIPVVDEGTAIEEEERPNEVTPSSESKDEPAHEEAYIRLRMKEMGWPALLPACDALERWAREQAREPAGPPRQVLIADQRTAAPETPVCDLFAREWPKRPSPARSDRRLRGVAGSAGPAT